MEINRAAFIDLPPGWKDQWPLAPGPALSKHVDATVLRTDDETTAGNGGRCGDARSDFEFPYLLARRSIERIEPTIRRPDVHPPCRHDRRGIDSRPCGKRPDSLAGGCINRVH